MLRTRRLVASVLAVLAVVLLLLSGYGWWARRYFLDSERFTAKAGQIIDQEAVQNALSVAITDQISESSGRDLRIAEPFIDTIVGGVVRSQQFQTVFDAAVLRLHEAVIGGGARDAVLDLSSTVDQVRSAIDAVAPNLAAEIPDGQELQVKIFDKTQLDAIYDITNLIKDIVLGLTVATVLLFALALWVSPRRWRTLALTGWVMLGLFVVSLVLVRTGRWVIGSFADRPEYSDAAQATYKVITHGLVVQGVFFAVLGLLVGLGAGWTDRHGGWAAVTRALGRGAQRTPASAPAMREAGVGATTATSTTATATTATATTAATLPAGETDHPRTYARVAGVLAPRLPEPPRRARAAHWWRAAGLLLVGVVAVWSPGSLTTVIVVLLGIVALYLALTEALAAWGSPREPADPDETSDAAPDARESSVSAGT